MLNISRTYCQDLLDKLNIYYSASLRENIYIPSPIRSDLENEQFNHRPRRYNHPNYKIHKEQSRILLHGNKRHRHRMHLFHPRKQDRDHRLAPPVVIQHTGANHLLDFELRAHLFHELSLHLPSLVFCLVFSNSFSHIVCPSSTRSTRNSRFNFFLRGRSFNQSILI